MTMDAALPEARYYTPLEDSRVRCELCPHRCIIPEGKTGVCTVRLNREGRLTLPYYGKISSIALDPIEKKPLYHFHPGSVILSIGFFGCSFKCPFCQNFEISQEYRTYLRTALEIPTDRLIHQAKAYHSIGIAYTYSEPLIHFEYVMEVAVEARRHGLKNVLVTNGYINPEPADELLEVVDAANVDLKSFNDEFYRKEIKGSLEPVLAFIEKAAKKIHVEVTTLLIPGKNESEEEVRSIARRLAGIRKDIPLHLSAYFPRYKYTIPPTPRATVYRAVEIAKEYLDYVHAGNV
ncbi:Radical SAM domain protein [Spirochaeta thermophila DSM 6578]|uniref:Radical SAM domain protein n=1 Tax=Winmispira thermophila (strain ATCC 700085 / DSM 6578 / Z-1203) TaxID=869211 RepID=G0GER6_WINT7|nr:AmmeMemoRadiSam system radical SAM enzyme [Spirochaeta thermophila]AEJ61472.1 Radical SAM domain protein [Spirochaeta thermophila DSM 6578]